MAWFNVENVSLGPSEPGGGAVRRFFGWPTIVAIPLLSGCITTTMQGYADRDLPARPLVHIAYYVAAPTALSTSIRSSVVEEARKRGMAADDVLSLLPPTRSYTDSEIRRTLAQQGVDGVLIVAVGDTGVLKEYAGTVLQANYSGVTSVDGSAIRVGNTTNWSAVGTTNGTVTATATPTYRYSRQTSFAARMIDSSSGRVLWVGNGEVKAGGLLFVGDGANSANSVAAIFENLQSKGVIGSGGNT
jgi:hypothetical protein